MLIPQSLRRSLPRKRMYVKLKSITGTISSESVVCRGPATTSYCCRFPCGIKASYHGAEESNQARACVGWTVQRARGGLSNSWVGLCRCPADLHPSGNKLDPGIPGNHASCGNAYHLHACECPSIISMECSFNSINTTCIYSCMMQKLQKLKTLQYIGHTSIQQ